MLEDPFTQFQVAVEAPIAEVYALAVPKLQPWNVVLSHTAVFVALQLALLPAVLVCVAASPLQDHVNAVAPFVTEDCVPVAHKFAVGDVEVIVPFAVPQVPAVPVVAALLQLMLELPLVQVHVTLAAPIADVYALVPCVQPPNVEVSHTAVLVAEHEAFAPAKFV